MNSIRIIYKGIHSKPSGGLLSTDYVNWTILRVTWPPIHSSSIVLISASECFFDDDVQRFTPVIDRKIGDASITVRNIAPQEGFVDFWIYVDWENPINVMVDLVVFDPPVLEVVVDGNSQQVFQVNVSPQNMAEAFLTASLSKEQQKQYRRLLVEGNRELGQIKASVKPSAKRGHKSRKGKPR